jgi:hypothetical protein
MFIDRNNLLIDIFYTKKKKYQIKGDKRKKNEINKDDLTFILLYACPTEINTNKNHLNELEQFENKNKYAKPSLSIIREETKESSITKKLSKLNPSFNEKKYKIITNENSTIKLPENYSTDNEKEYLLVNLINEDVSENNSFGWEHSVSKKGINVYLKKVFIEDEGKQRKIGIVKTYNILEHPFEKVIRFLNDFEERKKIEPMYKKGKILENKNEDGIDIQYSYLHLQMPLVYTDREFVQVRRLYKNYGGNNKSCLFLNYSINRDDCPITQKRIRAEFIVMGMYLEEIAPNKTKEVFLSEVNMKMDMMISIILSMMPNEQYKWQLEIMKYLGKYK